MTKNRVRKRVVAAVALVAGVVGALAATAVAQSQRFPDVPPDHEAYEAIEWAAEVGVTTGYTDGTFKPELPLSKRHAVVFLERFYDSILGADQSDDFTRGDMMMLLKAINDGGSTDDQPAPVEATASPSDLPDLWDFAESSDELTGNRTQLLGLEASNHSYPSDTYGIYDDAPVLLIGCRQGDWGVLMTWGGQLVFASDGGGVSVAYRLDDGDVVYGSESEVTSYDGVWINNPKGFVSSLLGKETLVYRVWNYDGAEVGTATFPIAHLENRIDAVTDCSL